MFRQSKAEHVHGPINGQQCSREVDKRLQQALADSCKSRTETVRCMLSCC